MGTQTLVILRDIEKGKKLIHALDQEGVTVRSAFWFYVATSSEWRLFLAAPLLDRVGPRASYETVYKALVKHHLADEIPLRQISIVAPDDMLPQSVRRLVRTTATSVQEIRVTNTTVGNVLIDDAYVYRSA